MHKTNGGQLGLRFSLVALVALAGIGCGKKKTRPVEPEPEPEPAASEPASGEGASRPRGYVVSFLYAGPRGDYGFNEAHAAGAAAVAKLPGVTVVEEDNVVENSGAALAIEKQIALQGAKVVFATGFGHFDPGVLTEAKKHPDVHILHNGGFYQEGKHPQNAGTYTGFLDEAYYVSGVVAGLTTRSGRLGFIAAKPLPYILRNINAFTLGARSVNPRVTTSVVFTGSWSAPETEAKLANEMADKKVDVIAAYVNSPRTVLETAEKRGIYSIGAHSDGTRFAPRGYLTGAESHWERIYTDYVRAARDGRNLPPVVRGGLSDAFVGLSPFGLAVTEPVRKKALATRDALAQGRIVIFKGPLKDNRGKLAISAGQQVIAKDVALEVMSYLVEGNLGSLR